MNRSAIPVLPSWIIAQGDHCVLRVRLTPRARREQLGPVYGDALKISVLAPPVDGRANQALLQRLAQCLNIPPGRLAILSGATGRQKQIAVHGLSAATATARLSPLLSA
ncbi:MAG: DUF167 domain-containing protein [Candidatus Marinimicrobia bacterium]|nr:DUF167 domain-containing protein [Candidatus Neomarinimicrobiota bacterium]